MTTTARRIQYLMSVHGHSLRDAERHTGVTKSTLQRILDEHDANLEKWLPRIAEAYGATASTLMAGGDPRTDFEWAIRLCSVRERFDMVAQTMQARVRDTLDFLFATHPTRCSPLQVAAAAGMTEKRLQGLLVRWDKLPPDLVTARALAHGIHRLTSIPMAWFEVGVLEGEHGLPFSPTCIAKAATLAREGNRSAAALTKQVIEVGQRRYRQAF